MAISWTNVVNIDAALSSVPTGTQNQILSAVDRQIDDAAWYDLADDGRTYLAAHMATLYLRGGGGAGPITSESLGPMSRSYGMIQFGAHSPLETTNHGLFFLHLVSLLPASIGFVA